MKLTNWAARAAREAYDELTVAQKRAWNLCKKQGLSEEDASVKLQINRSSLRDRLNLAEKKFRKHLELIKEQYGN